MAMPSHCFNSVMSFFSLAWLRNITVSVQGLPVFFFYRPFGLGRVNNSVRSATIYETVTADTIKLGSLSELVAGLPSFTSPEHTARSLAFDNPEILYKIKTGNYLPDELTRANFTTLIAALNFKSISGFKADWFLSDNISNLLNTPIASSSGIFSFFRFNAHNTTVQSLNVCTAPSAPRIAETLTSTGISSLFFSQVKQARVLNN